MKTLNQLRKFFTADGDLNMKKNDDFFLKEEGQSVPSKGLPYFLKEEWLTLPKV